MLYFSRGLSGLRCRYEKTPTIRHNRSNGKPSSTRGYHVHRTVRRSRRKGRRGTPGLTARLRSAIRQEPTKAICVSVRGVRQVQLQIPAKRNRQMPPKVEGIRRSEARGSILRIQSTREIEEVRFRASSLRRSPPALHSEHASLIAGDCRLANYRVSYWTGQIVERPVATYLLARSLRRP